MRWALGSSLRFWRLVVALVILLVNLAWLFAGAALTRAFRAPGPNRIINVTFAILLIASVAVALRF